MATIDADCHVIETDHTWDYLDEADRHMKPQIVPSDTDPQKQFWVIDGTLKPRPFGTAATGAAREAMSGFSETTEAARTGGMPKLYGTPEVVAERLEAVRGMGIKHIISNFGFPGLPHEKTMRSLELFATHVMPHFKEVPTGATAG